jgi:hypothetical protein
MFLGAFAKLRKATTCFVMSVCPSVRPHGATRFPLAGFSSNFILEHFSKAVAKIQVSLKSDKNNGYYHEYQYTFMITSCSVLLTMRNVSDKICREHQSTHLMFNNSFFENRAFCEIMWKNMVQPGRAKMTIRRNRIACWITKVTDTRAHRIHNTYCLSTAKMVTRTRLDATFILQSLSCYELSFIVPTSQRYLR